MAEHYFTQEPTSEEHRRSVSVTQAGRPLQLTTASGVYSPERLDPGTAILLREAPEPPERGRFVDVGCGWGPIALTLALLSPDAEVIGVDVNERALRLARENAAAAGVSASFLNPEEYAAQHPEGSSVDLIWSNPPIHIGKAALHDLLRTWLPRLSAAGAAYLVVGKNLGSDSLQKWIRSELGMSCERYSSSKGFRILEVTRTATDGTQPALEETPNA